VALTARRLPPWRWVRIGLEVAGTVAAWIGGFELVKLATAGEFSGVAQYYVLISLFLFVGLGSFRLYQTLRKERYANISPHLHDIQHAIRDIQTYIDCHRPLQEAPKEQVELFCDLIKDKMSDVLTHLQLVFTSITATHCRTSIKLVYRINGHHYYYTMSRDRGTGQQLINMDNKRVDTNHDPLSKNKPFSKIFATDNESWYYTCADLESDPEFTSTSYTAYDPEFAERAVPPRRRMPWSKKRDGQWVLPYRSTIACIIRQGPAKSVPNDKTIALGFLTVDSESRGVFEERWDVQLMFSVADALFHPLRLYLEIQNQNEPAAP